MLPKKRRAEKGLYGAILKNGRTFHSPHLSLRVAKRPFADKLVFSFVVSRSVSSKAHERNKLKRRGYAAIKDILAGIKDNGSMCVFFFKKGSARLSFFDMKKEIVLLLEKAALL